MLHTGRACAGNALCRRPSECSFGRLNARIQDERDGGREYDFGTDIHKLSYFYLFPPYLIFSYVHISFISSGCIYISESEKERKCYISEHAIYLHYLLIFFVCFVTCTIFSICLNLSSMSAWISVLQSFVADRKRETMQFRFVTLLTAIVLLQHLTVKIK